MQRAAVALAWLTTLLIAGEWLVVLPLFAMGAFDAGRLYRVLLLAAFFGWPAAAGAAAIAATSLHRHSRRAAVLLIPCVAALAYPLPFLAPVPLAAAILALVSNRTAQRGAKTAGPR